MNALPPIEDYESMTYEEACDANGDLLAAWDSLAPAEQMARVHALIPVLIRTDPLNQAVIAGASLDDEDFPDLSLLDDQL